MSLKLAKLNGTAEIFHTLQGEGTNTGMPAIFIRSSLCNLHCTWCDTDYTWNWENTPWSHDNDSSVGYQKHEKANCIIELTPKEIFDILSTYPCDHLVLTGGEPLLQQDGWIELLHFMRDQGRRFTIEVETNGTKIPSETLDTLCGQYNVSPKLSNSNNSKDLRYQKKALQWFRDSQKAWFKFVVQTEQDLNEVKEIITENQLDRRRILLMPEGRTPQQLHERRLWLADICRDQGLRFSDRLHVQLWGSKRGV